MKYFQKNILSPENQTAVLKAYLLDAISVAPEKQRPAIIICPGGGYGFLSDREEEPVVMRLLAMGVHVFVLEYSVSPAKVFPNALIELAKSVDYVRSHADEWYIDKNKIIVAGFSAGGHLAASLGVFWNHKLLREKIQLSSEDIKPNGLILCYPVITSGKYAHQGSFENLLGERINEPAIKELLSLEKQVGPHTPKTFLWHTVTDDVVPVENSLIFAEALIKNSVNLEMHFYPVGVHGLSLANEEVAGVEKKYVQPACQSWIDLLKTWLSNF